MEPGALQEAGMGGVPAALFSSDLGGIFTCLLFPAVGRKHVRSEGAGASSPVISPQQSIHNTSKACLFFKVPIKAVTF